MIRPAGVAAPEDLPDRSDEQLVEEMAGGSTSALREMYERLGSLVYALSLRITRNEADAEEVLVDAFHQAWTQAGSYQPGRGKPAAWILAIARSRAIDRLRRRARQSEKNRRFAEETATAPAPPATDPEEETIRRDEGATLRRALADLPKDQRWAIELAYFLGFSQSQIAERLGLPLGTIKTRMRLGLAKLREQLGGAA